MSAGIDEAVYQRLAGLALESATAPHAGRAPGGTGEPAFPYTVFQPLTSQGAEYDTGATATETLRGRFEVYAIGLAQARRLLRTIEAAFVLQPLTLESGTLLLATKAGDDLTIDPDRADDGSEIWHGVLDLEFLVERVPGS